ncbi:MAG: DUF1508 domain-containing protein [Halobacteriales archaeon]|nr:DUF1508 domain-containing protein [Halobacteriales archaeon]
MANSERGDNVLMRTYTERFGEPFTDDEVYGYWLFVAGGLIAVVGMGLFFLSVSMGWGRGIPYLFAATGLTTAVTGLIVGRSLHERAQQLVYVGFAICLAALAWFLVAFPEQWRLDSATTQQIIGLYTVGVAAISLSGAIAPVTVGQSDARKKIEAELQAAREEVEGTEETVSELREEHADAKAEMEALKRELRRIHEEVLPELREEREVVIERFEELQAELETARETVETAHEERDAARAKLQQAHGEIATLETRLERFDTSDATFDVYHDDADEWRWRLVHRNGNIIATSGEGYASDRSARRGMENVKRNAAAAAVVWQPEGADPEPDIEALTGDQRSNFELYRTGDERYRWRLRHEDGTVLATAVESLATERDASEQMETLTRVAGQAGYLDLSPTGIEVYEDSSGDFRWRLLTADGAVVAISSEGHDSRNAADEAAARFQSTVEASANGEDGPRFERYIDGDEYHWWLAAADGDIIATAGKGYEDAVACDDAMDHIRDHAPDADRLTVGTAAVELYEEDGKHHWRLRHESGTVLAIAGDGHESHAETIEAANRVKRDAPDASVIHESGEDEEDAGDDSEADSSEHDEGQTDELGPDGDGASTDAEAENES